MARDQRSTRRLLESLGLGGGAPVIDTEELARIMSAPSITHRKVEEWVGFPQDDDIFLVAHGMQLPTPRHTHDYAEFCYMLSGRAVNVIERKRLYLLESTLCAMNQASEHALEVVDSNAVIVNVCLRPSLFDQGVFRDFLAGDSLIARFLRGEAGNSYLVFSDADTRSMRTLISAMLREYHDAGKRQTFRLSALVLLLLDELARAKAYSFYGLDGKALEMLEYLRDHCDTVTVRELARRFGYSENYCSQYLRTHTGRTATELIANARITRAEELLNTTQLDIQAIAKQVGYRSASHFYEAFKRRHGMTPADYRSLGSRLADLLGQDAR